MGDMGMQVITPLASEGLRPVERLRGQYPGGEPNFVNLVPVFAAFASARSSFQLAPDRGTC